MKTHTPFTVLFLSLVLVACDTTPPAAQQHPLNVQTLGKLKATGAAPLSVPRQMNAVDLELAHYQAPQTLAGLTFSGEISSSQARTLRYQSEDRKESLYLIVSGLPAGWQEMDARRAVASLYSEVRQRRVTRALSNPANALSILSEQMLDLEGTPSAQIQLRWIEPNKPVQNQSLLITRQGNTFIRINNGSYNQSSRWLLQQAKRALAEFKAAQPRLTHPPGPDRAPPERASRLPLR